MKPEWRFIHVPKTAGTAILEMLQQNSSSPGVHPYPHMPALFFPENWLLFGVIRNPYDRLVSICSHIFRNRGTPLDIETFENWVLGGMSTVVGEGNRTHKVGDAIDHYRLPITRPQTTWLRSGMLLVQYELLPDSLGNAISIIQEKGFTIRNQVPGVKNVLPRATTNLSDYYTNKRVRDIATCWAQPDLMLFPEYESCFQWTRTVAE
jgi:hypothetical protein